VLTPKPLARGECSFSWIGRRGVDAVFAVPDCRTMARRRGQERARKVFSLAAVDWDEQLEAAKEGSLKARWAGVGAFDLRGGVAVVAGGFQIVGGRFFSVVVAG